MFNHIIKNYIIFKNIFTIYLCYFYIGQGGYFLMYLIIFFFQINNLRKVDMNKDLQLVLREKY